MSAVADRILLMRPGGDAFRCGFAYASTVRTVAESVAGKLIIFGVETFFGLAQSEEPS